jgi:LPS-assembly protein
VQVVAAPNSNDNDQIPNEDSLDIEFDETSLFSLDSRFPGLDRFEGGTRANIGVRYNLETDSGTEFEAVYGRVARLRDNNEFSDASGLREQLSDHVGALRLTLPPYFDVTHRFRIDGDDNEFRRHELYARGQHGPAQGSLGYVFVKADPFAGFNEDREEVYASAALKVAEEWTLYGSTRHDLEDSRFVFSGGGVRFENECCAVDLSVKRRFNDDRDANDETSVGLEVRLKSLGS